MRHVIAGGSHPRWERNLGTDEDPATGTSMKASHRTIDLAGTRLALAGLPPDRPPAWLPTPLAGVVEHRVLGPLPVQLMRGKRRSPPQRRCLRCSRA